MDIHWRYTQKPVRFFMLDARSALAIVLVLLHIAYWTLAIAGLVMLLFWFLERRGLTFPSSLRAFRRWMLGTYRPANHRRVRRYWVDFG